MPQPFIGLQPMNRFVRGVYSGFGPVRGIPVRCPSGRL